MCLPCPRLIRVLRTTLHHRYVHVLRQWRSKRRFEFFFVHPATGAQEFDHPFRVLPKYAASFQRTGLIGRWKTRTKGISILSLFHSSFPSLRISSRWPSFRHIQLAEETGSVQSRRKCGGEGNERISSR